MARHAGGICSYFLQGSCRFGESCWYEHPRSGRSNQTFSQSSGSGRRGTWSGHNQRYSNVHSSSFSKSSHWHDNRDPGSLGFTQNRFGALDSNENVGNNGIKDEEEKLLEIIKKDMEIWESSGQWMFSTYSPMKENPNVSGFPDFLPEELRLEYYNCRANNNAQNYINSIQQLVTQWRSRLLELKNINASTKTTLISDFKNVATQPPPAFGFGGQQAPAFGASTFPVAQQSSAQAFSFKSPSELASVSSGSAPSFGSAPAFGSLAGVQGVTTPSTASQSVGFGNQPASLASSFSFKTAAASGGFGASGFSGFGKSTPASSSDTTSASVFGAAVDTPPLNSGNAQFVQPANAFGGNVALVSPVTPTSITSVKVFTPKTELSAEELKQFEAKKFTLGKIPLKPPPLELLSM